MASSVAKNMSKKTTLRSSDGEVSVESQTTKHLSKAAFFDKSEDKPSVSDKSGFHFDSDKLFERARAANKHNIMSGKTKSPLDVTWEFTAELKEETPKEEYLFRKNCLHCANKLSPDEDPWMLTAQAVVDKMKEKTRGKFPKTTLRCSDGVVSEVCVESQTTKHLSKAAFSDKSEDKPSDADDMGFHFDFDKMEPAKLWKLAKAANKQNILSGNTKSALDLACEVTADMKGITPEEVRMKFNTKMEHYLASASTNINTPLDQDPWVLTCQAIVDKMNEKTPGGIPKTTKNKENYLTVAHSIVGKTPQEIRKMFSIKNNHT